DLYERERRGAEGGLIRVRHEQGGGESSRARARGGILAARAGERDCAGDGHRRLVDVPARARAGVAGQVQGGARSRREHGRAARSAGGVLRQAHAHGEASDARQSDPRDHGVPERRLQQDDGADRERRRRTGGGLPPLTAPPMSQVVLRATDVTKAYAGVQALKRASLELRAGEVHALVGENGAGKSTLIKILTGAVQPDSGEIALDGAPLPRLTPASAKALGIAAIYQQPALFGELTVAENIAL